jgi:hypothetical protein
MQGSRFRHLLWILALATVVAQSGCAWLRGWYTVQDPPPQALPRGAGLEQVISAVNQNNSQIWGLFSNSATIKGPGYPTLRAHIAYQRPRNFRLKADGFGPEVDLGSNDQLFWFWIKRSQPPGVFYCRHDQFPASQARRMIPVDPSWLIEALGTVELDRRLPFQGPYPDMGNRIQIRTVLETPEGPNVKVIIVDAVSAWVMEQRIVGADGRLRARSVVENYRRDPRTHLYVPTAVQVECPDAAFSMRIDLGDVQVNQLQGNPAELWSKPEVPGTQSVDLGNPNPPYDSRFRMSAGR